MAFLFPPSDLGSVVKYEVYMIGPDDPAMTFDEVSMENRKSALQELKNLRPQLYAAAKYSQKSFHHSEMKHITMSDLDKSQSMACLRVLDNLKDYAAKALVNTVDHLGTVAHKLTDLLEQKTLEVSTMELKASCLNQQLLICQTYSDKEGLRQQQILSTRSSFPFNMYRHPRQKYFLAKSLLQPFLYSCIETSFMALNLRYQLYFEGDFINFGKSNKLFTLLCSNKSLEPPGNASKLFHVIGASFPASPAFMQTLGVTIGLMKEVTLSQEVEGSKPSTAFGLKLFHNQKRENIRAPVRGKNAVSAFFVKQKAKLKGLHILHEHRSPLQKGNEGDEGDNEDE
ncbi:hypothetical protein F3Y22_tig00116951pilonHSYRG00256 [Hibiscus syriacus]|uniref:Protein ABIL1 n=1 Tax=Hibiscus syriacus TaxID=106335 RepID=A0A6A2XW18_HIBSY|nr:hypothetical protein F3Y22_tig00116951pilonHSYRG00256 [Hibiscus syriacus]